MNHAFSKDPAKPGEPRLRLRLGDESPTAESLNRGVRALGEACFRAIRNPLAHETGPDLEDAEALEMLACLSRFARWVEEAELEEVG